MVSIDLKDACLQVPVHPDSCQFLCFVVDGTVSVSSTLFRPLHGPPSLYQGHGSCIGDASHHGRPDTLVSGRLADPSLLQVRGSVGKEPSSVHLQSPRHCHKHSEVFSSANTDCNLPYMVIMSPSLRVFPSPAEGFHPADANYRISVVLQTAKHRVLALSRGSPVVSLSSCPRTSPSNEVSAVASQGPLGFFQLVCRSSSTP